MIHTGANANLSLDLVFFEPDRNKGQHSETPSASFTVAEYFAGIGLVRMGL